VQVQQRVPKAAEAFEPVDQDWVPYIVHGARAGRRTRVAVQPGDCYASVDDVADGVVVFSVSEWPRLDREGRLCWTSGPFELVGSEREVQEIVNAARVEARITAPDRPIRVGDAFLVRGLRDERASLSRASLVLDISAAARDAARAALYGAVASTLPTDDAKRMAVTQPYEQPEPAEGHFDVRQRRVGEPGGAETAS
jgi:hypothetical protein